jgi:hypothetical protein
VAAKKKVLEAMVAVAEGNNSIPIGNNTLCRDDAGGRKRIGEGLIAMNGLCTFGHHEIRIGIDIGKGIGVIALILRGAGYCHSVRIARIGIVDFELPGCC